MNQQLRNVGAMRLVRGPRRVQLDSTDDPSDIPSHEEDRPRV